MSEEIRKFSDIPQFVRNANYRINVPWRSVIDQIEAYREDQEKMGSGLDMSPDFQRVHVWTLKQKRRYVEFILRGGDSSKEIHWNCKGWGYKYEGPMVLVDGKQRLNAVTGFLNDKFKVFGKLCSEFEDGLDICRHQFIFHINNLETREDILKWYLGLNFGGTPHTDEERAKVEKLLVQEMRDK